MCKKEYYSYWIVSNSFKQTRSRTLLVKCRILLLRCRATHCFKSTCHTNCFWEKWNSLRPYNSDFGNLFKRSRLQKLWIPNSCLGIWLFYCVRLSCSADYWPCVVNKKWSPTWCLLVSLLNFQWYNTHNTKDFVKIIGQHHHPTLKRCEAISTHSTTCTGMLLVQEKKTPW